MAQIVIVEPNGPDRVRLRNILESAGHETYATLDVEQVVNYSRAGVDMIFTALDMPEIHGLELIMTVRARVPEVAVIAISATGPEQLAMAEAVGAIMSFRKPLEPAVILDAVRTVVKDHPL